MMELPQEFCESMQRMPGLDAAAFFAALQEAPALALRVNLLRGSAALEAAQPFITDPVPWAAGGYYIQPDLRPGAHIAHCAGAYYIQEASAMVASAILNPQPGERVLDLCAAPGGKATQTAAAMGGRGVLVANEPEPARAKVLAANLERMGVSNSLVTNAYPDALAKNFPDFFDAIQCDAPCSGEGMFRRDPDSRGQWFPAAPGGCAKRQGEILDRAAEMLRPGGRLVYSTCTFNSVENEGVVAEFLARHPDFYGEDFALPGLGASKGGMIRVWPHLHRGDGHFACLLRRRGDCRPESAPPPRIDKCDRELLEQLSQICDAQALLADKRIFRFGEHLYAAPMLPELRGVRIVSGGLCLCRIGKNYIEPAHALAMAIDPAGARCAELDDAQAARYLMGEALPCDAAEGWNPVLWRGLALGWGKVSGGTLKNHLPKALRRSAVPTAGCYRVFGSRP